MRVSIVTAPCRRLTHAAWWNGHAAHVTTGDGGAVSGLLHLRDERAGVVAAGRDDVRLLGGEVDGCLDPVEPVQPLLDARGAGRARHARDLELDRVAGRTPDRGAVPRARVVHQTRT